jgi:replicative superfamily II helicase
MVDFKKLREAKAQPPAIEPIEIFRRLPKSSGINDLYTSQAQVLKEWFNRRDERDLVIKLHTGGGKTLVGLLIAQSSLHENNEPVIYLSPTVQLVQQTLQKASEYRISAVAYEKGSEFSEDFLSGKSVLVCTYQALFNGLSRFGVRGGSTSLPAATIILDDAHVALSTVRDAFTLRVESNKNSDIYSHLINIFRNDFNELGKIGTFDDIASGKENGILEVPYWAWKSRSSQVREFLRDKSENYKFVWPFLRDCFDYCHCLINSRAFVITPMFPLVDLLPTFSDCPRRIFMSATISDDSDIIRTFDAEPESIEKPIFSNSLAGVSERMILAPELMPFSGSGYDLQKIQKDITKWASEQNVGTVILVPSDVKAKLWEDTAQYANSSEKVTEYIDQLLKGISYGPFVFANRYDGIDLPGSACRLLILCDLPRGSSEYDQYRANTFVGGNELSAALAQRIEQGMGRGARGTGDYCVVIVTGKDLSAWFGRSSNLKFLTKSTRAQFEMGVEISKSINDESDFIDTIQRSFNRDQDWIDYHAETLAELTDPQEESQLSLRQISSERKAFRLMRDGYFENAIIKLEKLYQNNSDSEQQKLDKKSQGWLKQFAARIAYYWDKKDVSQKLQQSAYADNHNLLRPQINLPYVSLAASAKQAEVVVSKISDFSPRRGYLSYFDEVVSHLVPEASANQFEQALENLGIILGFSAERPEKIYGIGPDVLWILTESLSLVIEAKSRKNQDNALTKSEHGQLLNAEEWFKTKYPSYECIRVSVHPNQKMTSSTVAGKSMVLTLDNLNQLIVDSRTLITNLCESVIPPNELAPRCDEFLADSTLTPQALIKTYLLSFCSECE